MPDGVLVVYKPRGPTSHDVVARVRRAAGERRVGHAGTLDPLAEGVLVLALGRATRLLQFLTGAVKRYRASAILGVETDTYDGEGRIVASVPVAVSEDDVRAALDAFQGPIEQRPPLHSAVRVGGRRLYEIARAGQTIEVPMRRVIIYSIDLLEYESPRVEFDVACSSGTYVRSLAHDLGQRLGTGAHLGKLVRLQVGPFASDQAVHLDTALERLRAGDGALLLPPDAAVQHLARVDLSSDQERRVRHGLPVHAESLATGLPSAPSASLTDRGQDDEAHLARAYARSGELLGIMRYDVHAQVWRPVKVLA